MRARLAAVAAFLVWLFLLWPIGETRHAWSQVSYMIRPYDMLADRRRWWWQPRTRCGWPRN